MAIKSNLAGVARVAFEAETGEFNRDVAEVERRYLGATKEMSDGALKLELAQERLTRAIAKGPAASREQARALLSVRSAERELAAETLKTTKATEAQAAGLSRSQRIAGSARSSLGGLAASMTGFGGGAGVATAALVGGAGLVYGLKSFVDAARDSEVVLGQTSVAVKDAGISWEGSADRIQAAASKISRDSALDDEEVLKSFAVFVRSQKDVERSIDLASLAADVARGRYTDLESATQLVNKAALGQIGALRRAGIQIDKNATSTEALDRLQRAYAGSAERYANSSAGAADRLAVSWETVRETFGSRFARALGLAENKIADIADATANAKEETRGWTDRLLDLKSALHLPGFQGGAAPDLTLSPGLTSRPEEGAAGHPGLPTGDKAKRRGDGLTRLQRLALASQRASLTDSLDDDLAAAQDEVAYYRRIAANKKLHGAALYKARSDLLSAEQHEQSIRDQIASDRQQAIDERAAKQEAADARAHARIEKAHRKAQASAKRLQAAEDKISAEIARRATKSRANLEYDPATGFFKTTRPGAGADADKSATAAQIAASVKEALGQMVEIQRRFAPNLQVNTGRLETHGFETVHELRRQTDVIERALSGSRYPGTGRSIAAMEAMYG